MKKRFASFLILISSPVFAVEGYNDIYLDREQPINIHSIYCGANFKNLNQLKPSYIYSNSPHIEKGTYYFSSAYGDFSYTFNTIEGKDPKQILARGLLSGGKTKKEHMKKEVCIVGKVQGLPNKLNNNIGKMTLTANDPKWDQMMVKLAMFGKPAFGKGLYKDQRTTAKHDKHDQMVFDANQTYLKEAKALFSSRSEKIISKMPKQLEDAIKYAHQEDGFSKNKVYPTVKEPAVWTPIAKERYNDQNRQRGQKIEWDKITQKNFDWLFKLTGKGNALESTQIKSKGEIELKDNRFEQLVTVSAKFVNGKTLELDYTVSSDKLPSEALHSLEEIKQQATLVRNSAIMGSKKPREAISPPKKGSIKAFDPTRKVNLFFSDFRSKPLGENYRYQ